MNINSAIQSGLLGQNRTLDNSQKAASDVQGTGRPQVPEQAAGRGENTTLQNAAVASSAPAASTKVVMDAGEVLGTNIDVRA